jgi:hypothetical protein
MPSVTITAVAGGGTVALGHTIVRCHVVASANACYYTLATAHGTFVNADSSIRFEGVQVVAITSPGGTTDGLAPGACGTSASLSVTLTHLVQSGTNRTLTVTTS